MRDFYELINQYPWTTIFLAIFIYEVIKCVMSNLKRNSHEQTIQSNHFRGIILNRVVPFFFTLV